MTRARTAGLALALAAMLALTGCGERPGQSGAGASDASTQQATAPGPTTDGGQTPTSASTSAPTNPTTPTPTSAPSSSAAAVDQDTLDQITAVLDQAQSTLDAVDQELAADEG